MGAISMLSRYVHFVKLRDGRYAVYNNLMMDVLYVDESEKERIINHELSDSETINMLSDKGIYINDESADDNALTVLRSAYQDVVGKIKMMYLILTNSCNLNCSYCFLENNPYYNEKRSHMSEDIAMLAASKYCTYIQNNGIKSPLIVLYGGEPLINFETIKKVIGYISENVENPQYSLITNGTLLTDEICSFLKKYNVNVGISIDGTKELHDKNRPFRRDRTGSFDSANAGRLMLKRNNVNYGLSMTLSPQFLKYQDEVINWLSAENETNIFYNLYHFSQNDEKWLETAEHTVNFITKSYDLFRNSPLAEGRIQRQIDSIIENKFLFSDCGAIGCEQFVVMPNGDITICHGDSNTGKHIVGNIQEIDISSIVNSEEGTEWVKRATLFNDDCLSCEALFCCGGGCKQQAQNLFGDREQIDKFHCTYVKGVLKWILEKAANNYNNS